MKETYQKIMLRLHSLNHQLIKKAEWAMHCAYLTAVSVEAHGFYSYTALGLLVVVIAAALTGGGGE